ncbi:hypothetical protein QO001_003027 [Methylobacterium brachiatum]|jgi:hypothetical protein|uniref:Uncharacterized protein n=1 Tax=Methylobacterium brachiatum TaxID=269660 RepID=A0AAJ1TX07_9HYPH|nr:hypothetical protein [Methylobacterium brachiatum]
MNTGGLNPAYPDTIRASEDEPAASRPHLISGLTLICAMTGRPAFGYAASDPHHY